MGIAMRRPMLYVLLAAMLWGTIGVVAKGMYEVTNVSPQALSLFRLGFAAPLLGVLSYVRDGRDFWRVRREDAVWWLSTGLSMAAYQMFIFAAVARTSVTSAQFLAICSAPILVAIFAPLMLQERVPARVWAAGGMALVGVALVLGWGNPGDLLRRAYWVGNLLALAAAASWAAYAIIARYLVQRYRVTRITWMTFASATVWVLPWAGPQVVGLSMSAWGWAAAVYLGVIATALAYVLYVKGLQHMSATVSVLVALSEPATAALLAAWWFDERLSLMGWLGVGLLVLALLWLARER